jgi:hypothetical protein
MQTPPSGGGVAAVCANTLFDVAIGMNHLAARDAGPE